jgi:two-component system sensor kinase FixL
LRRPGALDGHDPVAVLWGGTLSGEHGFARLAPVSDSTSDESTPAESRAPEARREQDQGDLTRLKQLLATCQDAVIFIDAEGTIVFANPATALMFAYQEGELVGRDVTILMAEPYASQHTTYVKRFESTGEKRAIGRIRQVSAKNKHGHEFPIELSVTQLTEGGDGAKYGAFIRDVSEKARLQGQLMERERAATVGTTASMLVHEIGNPLNNMALQLQALRRKVRKLEESEDSTKKVDACLSEIERLSRLVQEFRALSGRRRIVKKPVKLTGLIESVIVNMGRVADGVSIERELSDHDAEVSVDSDKIQQIALNLLHNALEAMPRGGTLTLRTFCAGADFIFEVADTGEGVPPGLDIFEPFVTSKSDGTGLGLAICSEIAREHDGRLSYETEVGRGTTFRLTLPIKARARA